MTDIFRPHTEPARTLYDAFQTEARKRSGRSIGEWIEAERAAVWVAARDYAQQHGLRTPTWMDVVEAEPFVYESADYGAKWAIRLAEKMTEPKPATGPKGGD